VSARGERDWPENQLQTLRAAVSLIRYWTGDEPAQPAVDEDRMTELDEARVPVLTPDGPGVLMWHNSD
jgi:hypothetical protein